MSLSTLSFPITVPDIWIICAIPDGELTGCYKKPIFDHGIEPHAISNDLG